jgi:hypothetical protein
VESIVFICLLHLGKRWWQQNEWRRRWRERDDE